MQTTQPSASPFPEPLPRTVIDAGVRALIREIGYDFNGDPEVAVHYVFASMLEAAEAINARISDSKSL